MFTRVQKAFTLIELLVVISIIALLLSVMIPSLNRARMSAQNVVCKTNMNQYFLAITMYTDDHNGRFPYPWEVIYNDEGGDKWCRWHNQSQAIQSNPQYAGALWKYLSHAKSHLCPTFDGLARMFGEDHEMHNPNIPVVPQYSYAMNAFLGSEGPGRNGHRKIVFGVARITDVRSPSRTFIFGEENPWRGKEYGIYGINDNALVTSWGIGEGLEVFGPSRIDLSRYKPTPDAFATYHRVSSTRKEEGVSNAVLLDGSIIEVNQEDSLWYAWPHQKRIPLGNQR